MKKRLLSLILVMILLITALPMTAMSAEVDQADTGEILTGTTGDCTWTYDSDTRKMVISGEGRMGKRSDFKDFNSSVKILVIESGVENICKEAFSFARSLEEVHIPFSVSSIGDYAFYYCTSLKSIVIPDGVTVIGERAFGCCSSLTSVELSKNLDSVEQYAFSECGSLKSVSLCRKITSLGSCCFGYDYSQDSGYYTMDDFTIYGFAGTRAESYANENQLCFVDRTIYSVSANITLPVPGAIPDNYTCTVPANCGYHVEYNGSYALRWYHMEYEPIEDDERFQEGERYIPDLCLKADDGYEFACASDLSVRVNGINVQDDYYDLFADNTQLSLFPRIKCNAPISNVSIKGAPTALAGLSAAHNPPSAMPGNRSYVFNYKGWCVQSGRDYVDFTGEFVAGETYYPVYQLYPAGGYTFADTVTVTFYDRSTKTATPSSFSLFTVRGPAVIATEEGWITSADCTITEPIEYRLPAYYAMSGDDDAYSVSVERWYLADGRNSRTLREDDHFVAGKTYYAFVEFTAKEGYAFTDDAVRTVNGMNTYYDSRTSQYYAIFTCVANTGYIVSGSCTSFLDDSGMVSLELLQGGTLKYFTSVAGNTGTYQFVNIEDGDYTLCVSKKNHVTRDYAITVSGNTTKDVKIHPKGDINGDGAVNNFDCGRVNSHARNKSTLTGYEFKCGDIDGNGKINNFDYGKINSHARGKSSLWT